MARKPSGTRKAMDLEDTQESVQRDLKAAFARTATVADTSPVKEKPEKEGITDSVEASTSSSSNDILDAIGLLSKKMDQMSVDQKAEIEELKSHISSETKVKIAEAVDPLKSEMHDVKQRITSLEATAVAPCSDGQKS